MYLGFWKSISKYSRITGYTWPNIIYWNVHFIQNHITPEQINLIFLSAFQLVLKSLYHDNSILGTHCMFKVCRLSHYSCSKNELSSFRVLATTGVLFRGEKKTGKHFAVYSRTCFNHNFSSSFPFIHFLESLFLPFVVDINPTFSPNNYKYFLKMFRIFQLRE